LALSVQESFGTEFSYYVLYLICFDTENCFKKYNGIMAKVEVVMPQMGESVMEGTVIEWAKKVGDKVETDETLLEIATDKVDTEVPSPETGILLEILVDEGDTVEVGKPIAIIDTDSDAEAEVPSDEGDEEEEVAAEPAAEETAAPKTESKPAEEKPATAAGDGENGERIEVVMPQMGESVMEGTIIEWSKSVGDTIETDEPLLEIATDKVDTEVPSPESGTLVEILVEAGETVEVGQAIAIIQTGKASASTAKTEDETAQPAAVKDKSEAAPPRNGEQSAEPVAAGASEPQRVGSDGRFYSPLVRSIAKEEGISQEELEKIEGSGKDGRVSKQDILNYLDERKSGKSEPTSKPAEQQPGKPAASRDKISAGELNVQRPSENVEIIKMDRMRKMIAEHMVRSKQTSAHVTTFADVDVTNVVRWREANKKGFQEKTGAKLTYTPIFIEQIINAMQEFPLINSSVDGDEIILKKDINFGLAVALGEGGKGGLIVPVIKQAQEKNLVGLAKLVAEVAQKARNKDLKPDDLVGGTITLTNYGSVGNLMGTPIINQPQVAILGTGVIEKRPVVIEAEGGDVIAIRHMMYLTMSYDHRIIDGAHGGAFLSRVKQLLESFDINRPI
jgi:2-oxoglutarate dehydrogenase dihydrolipoamide succinyltransferase (E2 component)